MIFSPILWAPYIVAATCCPHRDIEWPDWADNALVYTEYMSKMAPDAEFHAILWGSFGARALQYDAPRKCQLAGCCKGTEMNQDGFTTSRILPGSEYDYDPLTCYIRSGCLCPCCECVICQPEGDDASGLYHLYVDSKHLTKIYMENSKEVFATGRIRLIGLAPDAGVLVEGIRRANLPPRRM